MTKSAKYIKATVTKQIKAEYPNFSNMKNKDKKRIIENSWESHNNSGSEIPDIQLTTEEILGIHNAPHHIININRMQSLISEYRTKIPMNVE